MAVFVKVVQHSHHVLTFPQCRQNFILALPTGNCSLIFPQYLQSHLLITVLQVFSLGNNAEDSSSDFVNDLVPLVDCFSAINMIVALLISDLSVLLFCIVNEFLAICKHIDVFTIALDLGLYQRVRKAHILLFAFILALSLMIGLLELFKYFLPLLYSSFELIVSAAETFGL